MVTDYRERITEFSRNAPLQPTSLSKLLNTNSLFASAMLSEMTGKGLLKVSHLKVGSSPLYYSKEHPEHLLNFIVNLNEKERRVAELLREKAVLRDSELNPLQKVCIRNIRDFSRQLDVSIGGYKEVFWKWFLLSDDEAGRIIKPLFELPDAPVEEAKEVPVFRQTDSSAPVEEIVSESAEVVAPNKVEVPIVSSIAPSVCAESFFPKIKKQSSAPVSESVSRITRAQDGVMLVADAGDLFLKHVRSFLEKNKIVIRELTIVKKKTEFDIIIEIPSPLGSLVYFCKAKNGKRISNSDLSSAYVQGQLKKLPVVFLSPGELAKPARIFMKDLKGLTVSRL